MSIVEGTTLGLLTIASLYLVWAAIRHQEKQIEEQRSRWQCERCRQFSPTVRRIHGTFLCDECAQTDESA